MYRSERIGDCFPAQTKYLNLACFEKEYATDKAKHKQYAANAKSWKLFSENPESVAKLNKLVVEILGNPIITLSQALDKYEAMIKEMDPTNPDYSHYLRPHLIAHLEEASANGYEPKNTIILALQCPKDVIVGFGHADGTCKTDTGSLMECILYPILKRMFSCCTSLIQTC